MNHTKNPEESVIDFDALYKSMYKCKKGVLWKDSVAHFYLNGLEETLKLENQLHDGTYQARPPYFFHITSPKPRDIVSVTFRDRVYQRSLNDNMLYPAMTRSFIKENCACQKGKGTQFARKGLKEDMRWHYRRYGLSGGIFQGDIHGYYPNMRHTVAEETFKRGLPQWAFKRSREVLRGQYAGETGYNPGSQMVQIAGISVLSPLDHFIKEKLHIKKYRRYMDDFILIHPNESYLEEYCKPEIEKFIGEWGFELNPKKTRTFPFTDRFLFMGFYYQITKAGKVLMLIDPKKVKAERKKLVRMVNLYEKGKMPKFAIYQSYNGWKEHVKQGNTHKVIMRTDQFLKKLLEEADERIGHNH